VDHGSKSIIDIIIIIIITDDLPLPPRIPAEAISSKISKRLLDVQATKDKSEYIIYCQIEYIR
jgi:hypothetical protein